MNNPALLQVTADVKNLGQIRRFILDNGLAFGASQAAVDDLILAVNELATNIMVHGYQGQLGIIEIEVKIEADNLVVYLRDEAPPFDPTTVPTPALNIPLSQRRLGGMGIHLARNLTDTISYRLTSLGGNELTLIKQAR